MPTAKGRGAYIKALREKQAKEKAARTGSLNMAPVTVGPKTKGIKWLNKFSEGKLKSAANKIFNGK